MNPFWGDVLRIVNAMPTVIEVAATLVPGVAPIEEAATLLAKGQQALAAVQTVVASGDPTTVTAAANDLETAVGAAQAAGLIKSTPTVVNTVEDILAAFPDLGRIEL